MEMKRKLYGAIKYALNPNKLIFLVALLFIIPLYSEEKYNREANGLVGLVKQITLEKYYVTQEFGKWIGHLISSETKIYDKAGNLIEKILDSSIYKRRVYIYDEKGNQVEELLYKTDGSIEYQVTFKYDNKGNKIKMETSGIWSHSRVYTYDESGNLIEEKEYDLERIRSKSIYLYDASDNLIELIEYRNERNTNDNDQLYNNAKTIYTNDENGILREMVKSRYSIGGSLESVYVENYNDNGKLIESAEYEGDGYLKWSVTSVYDKRENEVKTVVYNVNWPDGNGNYLYKYDDAGNLIESIFIDAQGYIKWKRSFSYEYDSIGNWVKIITREEVSKFGKTFPEPIEMENRDITYYE